MFRGVFRQRERRKGKAADGERQAAEPAFCRPRGVVSLCFHVFFPQSDDGELPVSRLIGEGMLEITDVSYMTGLGRQGQIGA
ncbi:hypothetical protein GCM10022405_33550 [Gibbsiella dentisursi]|uniref:Transposase n=1 Tax=Gibbsiella dentisursi TaxID=796890 RepID=A0ABP7LQT0_9GAMM